jgi:hypothetical protein
MIRTLSLLRQALCFACLGVLLLAPRVHAMDAAVAADFDGDGVPDRVTVDRLEPSLVRIWLSRTGTTDVIHSREPLLHIVATDLDGDYRPEIIASKASPGLQIWTRGRKGFRAFHPRRVSRQSDLNVPHPRARDKSNSAPVCAAWEVKPLAPSPKPADRAWAPSRVDWQQTPAYVSRLVTARHFLRRAPRPPPVPSI